MKINDLIWEGLGSEGILISDNKGKEYLIYRSSDKKGDQVLAIKLNSKDSISISEQDIDCANLAAVSCRNDILIVWSQLENGVYQLYESRLSDISPIKITECRYSVLNHALAVDNSGITYLVYQTSDDNGFFNIYLKRKEGDRWSEPTLISDTQGNNWCPDIACCTDGKIAAAWDGYAEGSYNIYLRFINADMAMVPTMRLTNDCCLNSNVSLSPTIDGGVWAAWNRGTSNWGKDNEVYRISRMHERNYLHSRRFVELKRVYPALVIPVNPPVQDFLDTMLPGFLQERPRLFSSPDGLLYLSFRYNEGEVLGGYRNDKRWQAFLTCFNGENWSDCIELEDAYGLSTGRISISHGTEGKVYAAACGEGGDKKAKDLTTKIKIYSLDSVPQASTIQDPPLRDQHYTANAKVPFTTVHNIKYKDQSYNLYFGDLHRHTELSFCRTSVEGSVDEAYRYAMDAADLDFMAITDHDHQIQATDMWEQVMKSAEKYYIPGHFTTFFSYEWIGGKNRRHHNIISSKRVPVPPFDAVDGERSIKDAWETLQRGKAITIPHHTGCHMGLRWGKEPGEAVDPVFEPLVEIFQASRSSSEYFGCPTLYNSFFRLGSVEKEFKEKDGFVDEALKQNIRMGFIASSDHLSTHRSYACIYAPENTREALIDSMIARRAYAASDRIVCEFFIDKAMMGDEIKLDSDNPLDVYIRFIGTGKIKEVALLCDSIPFRVWEPKGHEAEIMFSLNAKAAKGHYFYIRMIQEDTNLAWSSPIWID